MTEKEARDLMKSIKTIASVGLSSSSEKESYGIVLYLKMVGYKVIPVNPTASEIMEEKSYPDLLSIPEKIDVVQIFRKAEDVPPIVDQAIQIGARIVWMQEGIRNDAAAQKAARAGLIVIQDECMRSWHMHLFGNPFTRRR